MPYKMTKEQRLALKEGNMTYLDQFEESLKQEAFLYQAIASAHSIKTIAYFLNKGVAIADDVCLDILAEKKDKVKIFKYLHSRGMDITPRQGRPCFSAAVSNHLDTTQYLLQFLSVDSFVIQMAVRCILHRDSETEKKTPLHQYEDVLKVLLEKCTSRLVHHILEHYKHANNEYNQYLLKLFMDVHLRNDKSTPQPRIKL